MPSAAAKKKRAANRAAQTAHTDTGCPCADGQQLQDEIVAFNDRQQQINADRKDLLKRIAAHSTQHSMDTHCTVTPPRVRASNRCSTVKPPRMRASNRCNKVVTSTMSLLSCSSSSVWPTDLVRAVEQPPSHTGSRPQISIHWQYYNQLIPRGSR